MSFQFWQQRKMRSLVLDPNGEKWGSQAYVETDEAKFWPNVWKVQGCAVIIDEAASTIRREQSLVPVFTKIRHQHHQLIVVGHNGMSLLPIMREQIKTIYLFRQPRHAADTWADNFAEPALLEATKLGQFEFLYYTLYGPPPVKRKLRLA